jgi:hypothetical protein
MPHPSGGKFAPQATSVRIHDALLGGTCREDAPRSCCRSERDLSNARRIDPESLPQGVSLLEQLQVGQLTVRVTQDFVLSVVAASALRERHLIRFLDALRRGTSRQDVGSSVGTNDRDFVNASGGCGIDLILGFRPD